MERKWTPSQQQAITSNAKKIVVSAAAGSGKTAVLVERIINRIRSGKSSIDRLLVVTFTNMAAAEMKGRIFKELSKETNEALQSQLALLQKANISTIHSFCSGLIRNNFFLLDLPPNFSVGDENTLADIRSKSIDEVLKSYYAEKNPDFLVLVQNFGCKRGDEDLEELIINIHDYSGASSDPSLWLTKEPSVESAAKTIIDDFYEQLETCFGMAEKAIKHAKKFGFDQYQLHLTEELKRIMVLKNLDTWDSLYAFFAEFSFDAMRGRPKEAEDVQVQIITDLRDNYKKIITEFQKNTFNKNLSELTEDVTKMRGQKEILCELVRKFSECYMQNKIKEQLFDFNDLEHFTIKLLENHGKEICKNFDEVYVDEFQDVSESQNRIFDLLSEHIPIFIVGDVKQSIYGFRSGRPQIFIEKMKEKDVEVINLSHNFRSNSAVIDEMNTIFERIMHREVGGVEYDDNHKLVSGREESERSTPLEIHLVQRNKDEFFEKTKQQYEASFVADRILELINQREFKFSDIAILTRTGKNVISEFVEEFSHRGIPYETKDSQNFFTNEEISALINLLSIIDNRLQDIALIAAMRSFLFGFDDEQIANIRLKTPNSPFYTAVENFSPDFAQRIEEWHSLSKTLSIAELLDKIYFDLGYLDPSISMQTLRYLAFDFESIELRGLSDFLGFLNSCRENEKDFMIPKVNAENNNTVKIMTLHKSKGLEFPVVFLVDCGKKFNLRDTYSPVLYDFDDGIALDYVDKSRFIARKTITKRMIGLHKKNALISEEMRDLYVALTRASECLFIYGTVNNIDEYLWRETKIDNKTAYLRKNQRYIDWLTYAADEEVPIFKHYEPETVGADIIRPAALTYITQTIAETHSPLPTDKTPVKASVSEILSWENVPTIQTNNNLDSSSAYRGTLIHFVMQALDFSKVQNVEEINTQIENMINLQMSSQEDSELIKPDKILEFFESNLGQRALKSPSVSRETKFFTELKVGEITTHIQGVIDLYFEENGELVIVDYKTGDKAGQRPQSKTQVEIYSKALEKITGKKVKEALVYGGL